MNEKQINERIKLIRKNLNMSQHTFAKKIGISQAALSNIEKGQSNPAIETLISIIQKFNISTDWILLGKTDNTEECPSDKPNFINTKTNSYSINTAEEKRILELLNNLNSKEQKRLTDIIESIILFKN